jgi:dienelactone hydrolase
MPIKETIEYLDEAHSLEGWLVYSNGCRKPAPGIVVFHEFMGLGAYLDRHLEKLADLGYVVMAADLYGRGVRPADEHSALTCSRPLRDDRQAMRRRARAALDCMKGLSRVEADNIAAVGYSLGGCAALELARSGASLKGAVSLYGYLDTPIPALPGVIQARLLVFHGIHDPVVPMSSLADYCQEMAAADADSRVVTYVDAGHGFCNRRMNGGKDPWNRYSRRHDQRSWKVLAAFLAEVLVD